MDGSATTHVLALGARIAVSAWPPFSRVRRLQTDCFSPWPYFRAFYLRKQGSFVPNMLFLVQGILHTRFKHHLARFQPEHMLCELQISSEVETAIDVIIGGPPCQAFARVGRAKLREVADHPEAFRQDARGNLYLRYLHYVRKLQPLIILMENVPDVINYGGHNIPQEMCEVLSEMGYTCGYTLLNAAFYGVPQMRERMFLIAYAKGLNTEIEFPLPTHWVELPKGYEGSRQVALKSLMGSLFSSFFSFYIQTSKASQELLPAITAEEALSDLPKITAHLEGNLKRGARHFNERIPKTLPQCQDSY